MTVRELITELEKINNKDAEIVFMDTDPEAGSDSAFTRAYIEKGVISDKSQNARTGYILRSGYGDWNALDYVSFFEES